MEVIIVMEHKPRNAFLIGNGIYLRPLEMIDVTDEYISWMNDANLSKFIPAMTFPSVRESVEKYVSGHVGNRDVIFFAIIEKSSGIHIGNIKLGPINWVSRNAEFGRLIGLREFRSKGYGAEAVALLLHYSFNVINMNKIFAGCLRSNVSAISSNKKAGLEVEAIVKEKYFACGKYEDVVIMGISAEMYRRKLEVLSAE